MGQEDLLYQTTVAVGRRWFKTKLRLFLSRVLSKEPDGEIWRAAVSIEEGFEENARNAWLSLSAFWASSPDLSPIMRQLQNLAIRQALLEAKDSVIAFYCRQGIPEAWVAQKLKDHKIRLLDSPSSRDEQRVT